MSDQQEILQKALRGDSQAVEQLIANQREGRMLRLYPDRKRDGPEDQGVAPLMFSRQENSIAMHTGRGGRSYLLGRKDFPLIAWLAETVMDICQHLAAQDYTQEQIQRTIDSYETEDLHVYCEARDGRVFVDVQPYDEERVFGYTGIVKLIQEVVMVAHELGWDDLLDEYEGSLRHFFN